MIFNNFTYLNPDNIVILVNILFFIILSFFFDITTLLIGFTLWADLFVLFYLIYLYNVPVLHISFILFASFRFIKLFSMLNIYLIVLGVLFVVLFLYIFIFKTNYLDNLRLVLKDYESLEILISDQVRTKFFYVGVLSLQTLACSFFIFGFYLLNPNSFFNLLSEIESDKQVFLFIFLFFFSIILIVSVELIIIKRFIPKSGGFDLLATLPRVFILIFICLLSFIFFDYFVLKLVNTVSGSESLISLYRIWRTGYSYNSAVEYSLAQRYSSLTQVVPPLIKGTKSLDLLELKFRLNLLDLELASGSKELCELLDRSYTWEDIKSLQNKHVASLQNLLATFSSTDSLAEQASAKKEH